jgi:putative SOS response-associated peptidase YedK
MVMCNRYGYLAPVSRLVDAFSEIRIPLVFPGGAVPNLPPRGHIRPTDTAAIVRPLAPASPLEGVQLTQARWWLVPFFHKKSIKDWKPMCANARAETLATTATFREAFRRRRCLVPASHFFEWTGPKGAKVMWRFERTGADLFCFAGLWDRAETSDGTLESFTIVTTAAGTDCAPYHDRQPVILDPSQWARWLDLQADPAPLLRAGPSGLITVAPATEKPSDA